MDVGGWLRNLGLGQYESAFIKNAIDTDVLPELTEGDLEKLGIPLGDRKRLIKAIKAVAGGSPSALITSEVGENAPSDARRAPSLDRDVLRSGRVGCSIRIGWIRKTCGGRLAPFAPHGSDHRPATTASLADIMSHGVLAYFGYPRAQEDDAERTSARGARYRRRCCKAQDARGRAALGSALALPRAPWLWAAG